MVVFKNTEKNQENKRNKMDMNPSDKNKQISISDILGETDLPKEIVDTKGTAYAQNGFSDLVDTKKDKKIDCPREIVFKIEGTVLNQDDKGSGW